ncbi:MAG: hypothetical protein K9M98_02975 [Cephaloticoccus sp.]|nr:hypothetical protein [Cephaloticoccus sp.]MCF7759444.1 hypothetical protein [Cephaloticoccus sp.]
MITPNIDPPTTLPLRQLLIVAPHFAPTNAPDMHRVRLMLPYLRNLGWSPTVLAIHPDYIEGAPIDPLLARTYPDDIPIIRTEGILPITTRKFGFGGLWKRCGRQFTLAGDRLISTHKFDLIFISTSQFDAFNLGPRWFRRFGIPYVLDFQDPWVNDYYRDHGVRPPGGKLKYWWSQLSARRNEPIAVAQAAALVCVSEAYGPTLIERYPSLTSAKISTLPFGASEVDFTLARKHQPHSSLVAFGDGNIHHVYAGRCTPNMRPSLDLLFGAFKMFLLSNPASAQQHRFHFIGTDYAPAGQARLNVMPAANAAGISDFVSEHTSRVPYFDALHYITLADALIILGSDDISYNASKMHPYLLAHRPVIVVAHQKSQILSYARKINGADTYGYVIVSPISVDKLQREIHNRWFARNFNEQILPEKRAYPELLTAAKMTAQLAQIFNRVVE